MATDPPATRRGWKRNELTLAVDVGRAEIAHASEPSWDAINVLADGTERSAAQSKAADLGGLTA